MTASVQTPTIGLGELIQNSTFFVPKHQRDYSWTVEFVDQFLDDIEIAQDAGNEEYFFGLMVFTSQDGTTRLSVIDGQQRLATTVMLLSAIRNWMLQRPALAETVTQISDRYIGFAKLGSRIVESKIIMNTTNNDLFRRYVIDRATAAEIEGAEAGTSRNDRNKRLLEAMVRMLSHVRAKAKEFDTDQAAHDYFVSLIGYLDESVRVVSLVPGGDEDAYTIFETLNDRGLALAPLDLVKNLLFSRAEKHRPGSLADMEARWNEMMTVLERAKIDSFLRVYWASRYGLTEGPKLFSAFKEKFKSARDAYAASIEIREVAENYVALSDPGDPVWVRYAPEARDRIEAIKIIGATQLHPLILSALERFKEREMERLLHLIEVVAVRYQLVARGRAGRMESLGSQVARKIQDGTITTAVQVRRELNELYTTDETFRSDFLTKTEKDKRKAQYMLRALELQSRRDAGLKHAEELQPGDVTIEHIMGKSLTPTLTNYLGKDADRHTEYRDRIGNLCLLGKANAKLGGKTFPAKVTEYATSDIRTTKLLAQYSDWRMAQIDQRQERLADLAVKAWRFQ